MKAFKDKQFMKKAIALAKKGNTFPNPMVGALLVKNGKIISEGYHKKAGMPHAEVVALRKVKRNLKDASLYVTLEPCAHYGKTPPCTESILKSGVQKLYVAMKDPNPRVNGKGLEMLRRNGVKVKTGICRREAEKMNRDYIKRIKENL